MDQSSYAIGQAVFIRTDSPDYEEEAVPFQTLEELVLVCSQPRRDRVLEKIIIYAMPNGEPCAVTLGFVAASKGQKPDSLTHLPEKV
jgi:hypothetical protein